MKPYYERHGVTIYCGDSAAIEGIEYDCVVSDPPYGMDYDTDGSRFRKNGRWSGARSHDKIKGDELPFDPAPWTDRPSILWGFNHFPQSLHAGTALVWIKSTDAAFGCFLSDCEIAWFSVGCGVYAYRDTKHRNIDRLHPSEKPVGLMKWCIGKVEGTILDPFMGSGTTLVAAKQLGRRAIGIEIEEKYCEIAARRLDATPLPLGFDTPEAPRQATMEAML